MFIWIIPANSVVMWVCMLISTVVICLMPFHFRPPIRPHFCLVNITVIHYRSFDFSGISQIALVLRLIGIWSPFSTISASAAFTDHVCVHCITKRVICATNFIAVQIFMGHCLLVIVHVPPGAAFIIHIHDIRCFTQTAKKYHVDFALKKDTASEQPRYLVFFKSRDADAITAAFQEFTARNLCRIFIYKPRKLS